MSEWSYCPECGYGHSKDLNGTERACLRCGQSWFIDVDYNSVIRANLYNKWRSRKSRDKVNKLVYATKAAIVNTPHRNECVEYRGGISCVCWQKEVAEALDGIKSLD